MSNRDDKLITETHGKSGQFKPWDGLVLTHNLYYYELSEEEMMLKYPDQYVRDHRSWHMELIWLKATENNVELAGTKYKMSRSTVGAMQAEYPSDKKHSHMVRDNPLMTCLHSKEVWKKWHSQLHKTGHNYLTNIDLNRLEIRYPAGIKLAERHTIDHVRRLGLGPEKFVNFRDVVASDYVDPYPLLIDVPNEDGIGGLGTDIAPVPILPIYYSRNTSSRVKAGLSRL